MELATGNGVRPRPSGCAMLGHTTCGSLRPPVILNNIRCSGRVMKYFRGLKISLVAKLVLAFVLVAVIPMLVAEQDHHGAHCQRW